MKLLFCGDVLGRSGREALQAHLLRLKKEMSLDAVVVNAENAAHGFGITGKICREMEEYGADVLTGGNHVFKQRDFIFGIDQEKLFVRPANYPKGTPGKGHCVFTTPSGKKLLVIQVMGRQYMDPLDDPFAAVDTILEGYKLGKNVDAILVDFHGEATSEKMAMGHYLDGRVSLVAGTHTHVPTADAQVFDGGTGYITDVGMCGDYNSVIGMEKEAPVIGFVKRFRTERFKPATGEGTLCGIYLETDDATGRATALRPIRVGGRLQQAD